MSWFLCSLTESCHRELSPPRTDGWPCRQAVDPKHAHTHPTVSPVPPSLPVVTFSSCLSSLLSILPFLLATSPLHSPLFLFSLLPSHFLFLSPLSSPPFTLSCGSLSPSLSLLSLLSCPFLSSPPCRQDISLYLQSRAAVPSTLVVVMPPNTSSSSLLKTRALSRMMNELNVQSAALGLAVTSLAYCHVCVSLAS